MHIMRDPILLNISRIYDKIEADKNGGLLWQIKEIKN